MQKAKYDCSFELLIKSENFLFFVVGIDRGRKTTLVFDYNASSDTVIANAETIEKTVSSIIEANAKDIPELFIELIADLRKTTLQELRRVHNRLKDVERKQ